MCQCSGTWFAVETNKKTWTPCEGYLSYLQKVGVGARVADGRPLGSLSSLQEWRVPAVGTLEGSPIER